MADVAPPLLDFTPIGGLLDVYRQSRLQAARENSPLLAPYGGDMALAQIALANERDARDFAARRGDVAFNQGITERQTKLAEQSAADTAKGFDYREIDDGNGNKILVKINKASGEITKPSIAGAATTPTNPFSLGGKQTETQSKDAGYADRMFRAESVLRDPKVEEASTSLKENVLGKAPGFLSNYLTNADYQKFDQAKRDFVNAVLRRESGAAISQSEFDNAHKQYFPQPGDTPERIAEKRRNRQDAIAGVAGGGGPNYKPPYTFGPNGELVSSGQPPRGQAPQLNVAPKLDGAKVQGIRANPQQAIMDGRAAIARGADPAVIAAHFQAAGIDPRVLTSNGGYAAPGQRQ